MAGAMVPANVVDRYEPPVELDSTRRIGGLFVFSVLKWRWPIMGVFLAVTIAVVIAMLLQAPVRSAAARVLLRGGRSALQVSGLAQGSRVANSEILRSEIQMMTSRDVFHPVAKMLLTGEGNRTAPAGEEAVELLARALKGKTVAMAIPESSVILVRHHAAASGEAVKILRMVIDKYLEVRAFADSGAAKLATFYGQELDTAAAELRVNEEKLRVWRKENNLASVDGELSKQLPALAEGERALQQTEAEIEATRAKIASLRVHFEPEPERIVLNHERVKNPLVATLKNDLATAAARSHVEQEPHIAKLKSELLTAELALRDALQRYTDKDRRVQEKREQAEYLKRELESARRDAQVLVEHTVGRLREELAVAEAAGDVVARETVALNPLREELKRELASAEALLTSLESRRRANEKQIRELSKGVSALRDQKVEEERQDRLVKRAVERVSQYAGRLDEARIAAGLEKEQLAAVSVIEEPYAELETDGARRLGMVLVAGILGLTLGTGTAFALESLRDRCRTAEEVEYCLGVPVLATVPEDVEYFLEVSARRSFLVRGKAGFR